MKFLFDTVLLIDDNDIENYLNTRIIQENGFAKHIVAKQSAEEALEYLLNEFNANNKIPELIFLDIIMPIVNGFEFLKSFETFDEILKSKTNIVMLTSSLYDKDIIRANENKLVKFLINKPLTLKALDDLRKKL